MRFLVDNQLPRQLVRYLEERGHDAVHVVGIGLEAADDVIVWIRAFEDRRVVISKDEDFFFLANRPGDAGSLLWLRIGNCRKEALFAVLDRSLGTIVEAFASGQRIVELA